MDIEVVNREDGTYPLSHVYTSHYQHSGNENGYSRWCICWLLVVAERLEQIYFFKINLMYITGRSDGSVSKLKV